jgi:hypothetical protein
MLSGVLCSSPAAPDIGVGANQRAPWFRRNRFHCASISSAGSGSWNCTNWAMALSARASDGSPSGAAL